MTPRPDPGLLEQFFRLVYGATLDGWLVLSTPDPAHQTAAGKPALRSTWFDVSQTTWDRVARAAATLGRDRTVYHGVVVQHPDREPHPWHRSRAGTGYRVPGLWFDLDLAYGRHAAATLPQSDAEAVSFLEGFPAPPSLIIHSGGGLYGWWLFKKPYTIGTEDERAHIARLSKQFTQTLVMAGTRYGWTLDALGDLARVLRPPGSLNTKYGTLVTLLEESPVRYDAFDFDWLCPLPTPPPYRGTGQARPTSWGPGVAGQPSLLTVAEHYGVALSAKSATELAGTHPVHGSSTSTNFNLNLGKGVWHCWRHGTGGDALTLIAVCEGLLACEAARPGALTGDDFRRVLAVARDIFHLGPRPARDLRAQAQIWRGEIPSMWASEVPRWH